LLAQILGKPLMPWQARVANVAGELDAAGLPVYREVRVTVPRQSGKTTLLLAVEVDRCLSWGEMQHVLYTAQDRNSARAKWDEQLEQLQRTELRRVFKVYRRAGAERLTFKATGSTIGISASGETSGHGQTLDLGIIDEAFAQRDERLAQAFRPAMMTRPAAQMWVVSTMGYPEGSEFLHSRVDDGRARVEAGERSGVCYFEWSAADDQDSDDPRTWWSCMPALGRTVTEEVIRADHDAMEPSEFSRAYLNRRAPGGKPVIDPASWQACRDPRSQLSGLPCFALDVTPERSAAAIGVAGWRPDRRRHVEVVEHRPGTDWAVSRLQALERRWKPLPVVVDPASPAGSLLVDLAAAGVPTLTVNAREYAQGCGQLFDAVVEGKVAHLDQPILNLAVGAARKRSLGDAWAWARKSGGDISPLVAVTLACWGLVTGGQGDAQIL
jgi:phage terminase large subunit-like protein